MQSHCTQCTCGQVTTLAVACLVVERQLTQQPSSRPQLQSSYNTCSCISSGRYATSPDKLPLPTLVAVAFMHMQLQSGYDACSCMSSGTYATSPVSPLPTLVAVTLCICSCNQVTMLAVACLVLDMQLAPDLPLPNTSCSYVCPVQLQSGYNACSCISSGGHATGLTTPPNPSCSRFVPSEVEVGLQRLQLHV
jgi:hypothetical protein